MSTLINQLRGPNELPVGTNFTQAVTNTNTPTLVDVTPGIGITSTTLTLAGTNFVDGESNILIGTDVATSLTAVGSSAGSEVSSLTITNAGEGYSSPPAVSITGGGGSGATATSTITGDEVTGLTITNGGSGYTSPPTVTIDGYGVSGGVTGLTLTNGGGGYDHNPEVLISAPPSGTTATATGTFDVSSGAVTSITITNAGSGYTHTPTVTISDASAPFTGHSATGTATITNPGATATAALTTLDTITCIVGTDYPDGTQKDVTITNNPDITNLTFLDENYHDTITVTLTVASAAASQVVLQSKVTNSITPSWSSPTLTIAGTGGPSSTGWDDLKSHLSNLEVLTGNYSSVFTIAVSIADSTGTGTTGTLTVTPQRATITNGYKQNTLPVWSTSSGTLGTFDEGDSISLSVAATDADSHTLTYTIASGSLPTGLSMDTSGSITGTASSVATHTTSTFTAEVTDGLESTTRSFSITINNVP